MRKTADLSIMSKLHIRLYMSKTADLPIYE